MDEDRSPELTPTIGTWDNPGEGARLPGLPDLVFTGFRWRSIADVHAMACYSVVNFIAYNGPSTRAEVMVKQGLAEINVKRAIDLAVSEGWLKTAGGGKWYLAPDREAMTQMDLFMLKTNLG